MGVAEVAKTFTEALKVRDYEAAEAMWSDDVVSIEAQDGPMKELRGREAVRGKRVWWTENHEAHSYSVHGPFVNGNQFALRMKMDVTQKQSGQRFELDEVAVYTVRGDTVSEERFYY